MEDFEKCIVIDKFEDGWGIDEFYHEDLLYDYCIEVLYIPEEKIEELTMQSFGLEIILRDLTKDDLAEDWYTYLKKIEVDLIKIA